MRNFIEIDGNIMNVDNIQYLYRGMFRDEPSTIIIFKDGKARAFNECFYRKIKGFVNPIEFNKDIYESTVNDFPGDNMIEE